nr:papilin-like isoform X2 [Lepeophtheirus salmonis]
MPLCLDWKSLFIWISFVLIFEAINASSPKCNEALDIGECNQNETKYYFNNETNECEEFVYGGCKGSENRFDSLSDCKTLCESKDQNSSAYRQWGSYPPIGSPREFDFKGSFEQTCLLPKVTGPCEGYFERYYFNPDTDSCEGFIYSGCRGNANNFQSYKDCCVTCHVLSSKPESSKFLDDSSVAKNGIVSSHSLKFERKSYGYLNHYWTSLVSQWRKTHSYIGYSVTNVHNIDWGNILEGSRATYTGHGQGLSRFYQIPKRFPHHITCLFPKEVGHCHNNLRRSFYNPITHRCESFMYHGCGGSPNNFLEPSLCQKICSKYIQVPIHHGPFPKILAHVNKGPIIHFPLYPNIHRRPFLHKLHIQPKPRIWHFKPTHPQIHPRLPGYHPHLHPKPKLVLRKPRLHQVKLHVPIRQRFIHTKPTIQGHNYYAYGHSYTKGEGSKTFTPSRNVIDVCHLPKKAGNCYNKLRRYYFDSYSGKCLKFIYTGCGGNQNNFKTLYMCKNHCKNRHYTVNIPLVKRKHLPSSRDVINVCRLSKETGHCYDKLWRYYYDSYSGKCIRFTYTGCGGNQNNFKTISECKSYCKNQYYKPNIHDTYFPVPEKVTPLPPSKDVNEVCRLSKEAGHCYNLLWRYYYDSYSGKCLRFTYTGCGGNRNNFKTLPECKSYCQKQYYKPNIPLVKPRPLPPLRDVIDVCRLSKETGHCYDKLWRYYYDSYSGKCLRFTYTGCGGKSK